jgi:hypothetical protein
MIKSTWHIEELRKLHKEAVAHTAEVYMNRVMFKAVNEVPFDTGRLANTGVVKVIQKTTHHIKIKASFGGAEGLAGASLYGFRVREEIYPILTSGNTVARHNKAGEEIYRTLRKDWFGISKEKNTLGRVTYAVRWHENSAAFQNNRKYHYLIDPFTLIFETGKPVLLADFCNGIMFRLMKL